MKNLFKTKFSTKKSILTLILAVFCAVVLGIAGITLCYPSDNAYAETKNTEAEEKEEKASQTEPVEDDGFYDAYTGYYDFDLGKVVYGTPPPAYFESDPMAEHYKQSLGDSSASLRMTGEAENQGDSSASLRMTGESDDLEYDEVSYSISGNGSSSSPYIMTTVADWNTVITRASSASNRTYVKLGANIEATGQAFSISGVASNVNNSIYLGALNIPAGKYISLDLDSYNIDRKRTSYTANGQVIKVYGDLELRGTTGTIRGGMTGTGSNGNGGGISVYGHMTMYSGTISYNYINISYDYISGGGVWVGPNAVFDMYGGEICYNQTVYGTGDGGGVDCGGTGSKMNMYGGTIHHNFAKNDGGGVAAYPGTFTLYDGVLYENTSHTRCGGLMVWGGGTGIIRGGEIHNNHSPGGNGQGIGGGVYVTSGCYLYLYGGKIYNNDSQTITAGVYFGGGVFAIGGPVKIYDNWITNNNADSSTWINSDLYLSGQILINGCLEQNGDKASVGMFINEEKQFTTGYGQYNRISISEYFYCNYTYLVYDKDLLLGTGNEGVFSAKVPMPYIVNSGGYQGRQIDNYTIYMRYTANTMDIDICIDYSSRFMGVPFMSPGVSLISRTTGGAMKFRVPADVGEYTIQVSVLSNLRWTDNTTAAKTYHIIVCPPVEVPTIFDDSGNENNSNVDNDIKTKSAIYSLDGNTVTFENIDFSQTKISSYTGLSQVSVSQTAGTAQFKGMDARTYVVTFELQGDSAFCWANDDLSDEPLQYYFIILIKQLDKPEIISTEGVTGRVKEVEYNGKQQTIEFAPALERYLVWSATPSGVSQVYHEGGILSLTATELGEYKISLSPVNNNVKWTDTTSTPQVFTFRILPRKVEIPVIYTTFFIEK